MPQVLEQPTQVEKDFLPLNGTDYIEFYVGNARQAAHYYRSAFGFSVTAYRGPETGTRECASYVLTQNKIRFVLTTPLDPRSVISTIAISGCFSLIMISASRILSASPQTANSSSIEIMCPSHSRNIL